MAEKQKFKKISISDIFPPNLFLLSSKMPGFNQTGLTHGEQSQVFTALILKVFFSVFGITVVQTQGVVHGSEVLQSGLLQTLPGIAD